MLRKTERPHRHANGVSCARVRNVAGLVLAGLTMAGVKWVFEFMEDRTMWENRYVLGGAGVVFLGGLVYWVSIIRSFGNVGEKARRKRVRSRWLRRRVNRALNRRLKDIV